VSPSARFAMMDEFKEHLQRRLLELQQTSDIVIKADILREVIWKRADILAVGVKVAGVREFDRLDIKFSFPSELPGEYPVPEHGSADLSALEWTDFGLSLRKCEIRFLITDEAVMRGLDQQQYQSCVRRASERLAILKDQNILDKIMAGAGKTVTAVAAWDTATAEPATDVVKAIGQILETRGVVEEDVRNMALMLPVRAYAQILKLQEINQIKQSIRDWLRETYGLQILPSKYLTKDGYLLIKGPETVTHGVLRPGVRGIPQTETKRHEGIGTEYCIRQFFDTVVVPDSKEVTTSGRICKITGVLA